MGNVVAASSPTSTTMGGQSDSGVVPPPSSPPKSTLPASLTEALKAEIKNMPINLENPGTVEELHNKCREIQASTFEGARIMLNKGLSNHFQISHTLNMTAMSNNGYRFGATYVGCKQYGPTEAFPVLLGDIDASGNLNANIIHQITSRLRCKFAAQFQDSRLIATQCTNDYRGDNYTASLTLGNPGLLSGSGVVVAQYLQSITRRLAMGTELAYQYGPNVPGRHIAILSLVGRYAAKDCVWSGTLGLNGLHICYYRKASDQLQLGVEVETSLRMQESVTTLAYQIDLPKADLIFRGSFDSNWHVCGVLEKRLQPLPFAFALSGRMNHVKSSFTLGCGLMIG
ncbi:mitochondrial import receptor subunit TOM40 homolog 2 [Drosophila tropicalis]|uniref:mitochondrial import receptor subunit TOM40 homolog 2 n=1 Tax=Drosophila tropicalis TaxID=46794 RepID=UPI0035ABC9F4